MSKYITEELSKAPFNFTFNLAQFNKLTSNQLIQVLSDVVCEIEERPRVDISEEDYEFRILTSLQIFKYKFDIDLDVFREQLALGKSELIHGILEWLLTKRDDLKKRAYLAKFLLKIDVPQEILTDTDIADLYDQYENLLENFKQTHKQWTATKNSMEISGEMRKDFRIMEEERDVLARHIERVQRKVENVPNKDHLLQLVKKLRLEKEKLRDFADQKQEQKNLLIQLQDRILRLQNHLKETRKSNAGTTPEALIQRMEDEVRVSLFISQEKLPKEISSKKRAVALMDSVVSSPIPSEEDTEELKSKIEAISLEIATITEKKALLNDPTEDGVALYRQQASIAARKKDMAAQRLGELRQELHAMENEKTKKNQQGSGEGFLNEEDFKAYVLKLRNKSAAYKEQRSRLNDLKTECGILSRTFEILTSLSDKSKRSLEQYEIQHGVRGVTEAREVLEILSGEKAAADEEKAKTLEEMSALVEKLNSKILEKKTRLAPMLRELRPLRQKYQESLPEYESKRQVYEDEAQRLELGIKGITEEKDSLIEEIRVLRQRLEQLESLLERNQRYLERATEEMKLYVSGSQDKHKSHRQKLQTKIQEEEKTAAQLSEEQRKLKENLPKLQKQMQYWTNLELIFQAKKLSFEKQQKREGIVTKQPGMETLVLQ